MGGLCSCLDQEVESTPPEQNRRNNNRVTRQPRNNNQGNNWIDNQNSNVNRNQRNNRNQNNASQTNNRSQHHHRNINDQNQGNDQISAQIRRQNEEFHTIEQEINNRFAQVAIKPTPQVQSSSIGHQILPIRAEKPEGELLCAKILTADRKFSKYLDGVYFDDCPISSEEYKLVAGKFTSTTQKHYKIFKIQKIFNPHLKANYLLRKKEYSLLYGSDQVKEQLLFHGTKYENVHIITVKNLDWRLRGQAKGHIFGQGVSFTPISNYASNYGDKSDKKVMLVFTVLVCHACVGNKNMRFPPPCDLGRDVFACYDTSAKPNGHVIVKFRDDEFYPSYIITYSGSPVQKTQ